MKGNSVKLRHFLLLQHKSPKGREVCALVKLCLSAWNNINKSQKWEWNCSIGHCRQAASSFMHRYNLWRKWKRTQSWTYSINVHTFSRRMTLFYSCVCPNTHRPKSVYFLCKFIAQTIDSSIHFKPK